MPVTEQALRSFMDRLCHIRPVTHKKMFGGAGLYCDGVFFAVIDNDRLYFKSDAATAGDYDAYGADQWVIQGDKPSPMPYREVPESVLRSDALLSAFIDAAIGVALSKKKKS